VPSQFVESGLQELVQAGIGAIQLHGIDRQIDVPDLGIRTFVATSPERSGEFPESEIIIDSSWGSGRVADWEMIRDVLDRPYILSGGLTPENVGAALEELEPDGVDVCSGVEEFPGKKDAAKLNRFLSVVGSFCDDS
jgi:phosphoribosylanthranilate isomerase